MNRQAKMASHLGRRYGVDPRKIRWATGDLRAAETDAGIAVTGFSNVETEDRHGTAFDPDGADQQAWSKNPIGFYNHDMDEPIVLWDPEKSRVKANADGLRGLWDEGVLLNETPAQQKATTLAKQVLLRTISIGFIPHEAEDRDGVTTFTRYEILEKSLVTVPRNRDALCAL